MREITKELLIKIYKRVTKATTKVKHGFGVAAENATEWASTGLARVYTRRLRSGRNIFKYRVGPGEQYVDVSIGKVYMTVIDEEKNQRRIRISGCA